MITLTPEAARQIERALVSASEEFRDWNTREWPVNEALNLLRSAIAAPQSADAEGWREIESASPTEAPGHTDMMVTPEQLDKWFAVREEAFREGAEAMLEEAALYMDSEEHSGFADAIRALPIPRKGPRT